MSNSNNNQNKTTAPISATPKEGFAGLVENWKADLQSGFLVSLIALPLSLGIAGASGFPPIMGVLTAIIGGMVVAFFAGSSMTIKGPAAGLIVIVAGSVAALGQGDATLGWKLTLGVIVIAAAIQIVLGLLKVASLASFFPLSAVHGMLAAIGIIILSKQSHFVLGVDPTLLKGKEPLELLAMIPDSLMHLTPAIALIGGISLLILFGMPFIKNKYIKAIPAPLVVLIVGIGLGQVFNLASPQFEQFKPLVNPGSLSLGINADFSGMTGETMWVFIQYVFLFSFIGSLESVLTGKAIDLLDLWKRKAKLNKDLVAVGIGNMIAGLLGGLPMISEVARSSANINNGGRTQWANFFHSIFLLIFVVLLTPVIKLVPIAALAAMLIYVGFRLASPKVFSHTYKVGLEQLAVFMTTIITTLATDLLIGIAAGIALEICINVVNGRSLKTLFVSALQIEQKENHYYVKVDGTCTFSNWISFEKKIANIPHGAHISIDATNAQFLDHTFMENILHLQDEYAADGGVIDIINTDGMRPLAKDHTSALKRLAKLN